MNGVVEVGHESGSKTAARRGMRVTLLGIACNAFLALTKGVAGWFGNSQALLADAVESATDLLSSLVVFGAIRLSTRPPDLDHPYGHGKAEPLAAALVAGALVIAAIQIARESIHRLSIPHAEPASYTLVVLIAVIVLKEALFRRAAKVGAQTGSVAVRSDAWHHRADALTSLAAFIGISLALLGGPGWVHADDWAAIFASAVILVNAVLILRPAVNDLMDHAPDPRIEAGVREAAGRVTGVRGLHRCRVRKMGIEFYVDLDVRVDPHIPVIDGHEIAHRVQDAVRAANPRIAKVFVHVEPFLEGSGHPPASNRLQ